MGADDLVKDDGGREHKYELLIAENAALKRLLIEMESKNKVLEEYCELLKENQGDNLKINSPKKTTSQTRKIPDITPATSQEPSACVEIDEDEEEGEFHAQRRRGWANQANKMKRQNPNVNKNKSEAIENSPRKLDVKEKWNKLLRTQRSERKVGTKKGVSDLESSRPNEKDKKIWLFLSKVKNTVTEEVVKKYVVKNSQSAAAMVEVKLCPSKKPNNTQKSFMLGVTPDLKEVVYGEDFWPAGVQYERFNFSLGRNFLDHRRNHSLATPEENHH